MNAKAPNSEKGTRYLGQLDQALCNGNWAEITELARKTDKHAPDRKCLTLAARTEAQIVAASHRPTSASSDPTTSIHGLGNLVAPLKEAITGEVKYQEDAYAVRVCLAEIYWLREEWEAVLEAVPESGFSSEIGGSHVSALGWLEVSEVKAAFMQVAAMEATGKEQEVRQRYLAAMQQVPGSRTPELRIWTERLLAHACMRMKCDQAQPSLRALSESLRCFSAWMDFWQRASPPSSGSGASPARLDVPRRLVWKAHYDLLSIIVQCGLMYNPAPNSTSDLLMVLSEDVDVSDGQLTSARLRQRTEMRTVEKTYESLLLNETQFPKASQTNTEVEEWVEQLVTNWKIVSGSDWIDAELGEGGKEGVGRNVLDSLYRAATKTFHSTAVLRQLFTVHAALGDFELAIHAFDSYVEIVSKGKDRAEKTGQHELGFDTDDSALQTAAVAVRMLCRYGDREQAEKALDIAKVIQRWLGQRRPGTAQSAMTNGTANSEADAQNDATRPALKPETLAVAYGAIGTSQANWIRLTYEADARRKLQGDAQKSLERGQASASTIDNAYGLSLLLVEMGDLKAATKTIKGTFTECASNEDDATDFSDQRKLLPMWHLLALCLSANDEYEQALRMCGAAFEQFGDASVLYGTAGQRAPLNNERMSRSARGLVDQMEGYEKDQIMQIKMTEIVILELMQGAEAAVESSQELLSLYARLFGKPDSGATPVQRQQQRPDTAATSTAPPKAGTLRSIAGSIRPRSRRRSSAGNGAIKAPSSPPPPVPAPRTSADTGTQRDRNNGAPISITVTGEDGNPSDKAGHQHHKHSPFKHRNHEGGTPRTHSLTSTRSSERLQGRQRSGTADRPQSSASNSAMSSTDKPLPPIVEPAVQSTSSDAPESPQQPLKEMSHNERHDKWPAPLGHVQQPPQQDVRLPAPHPASNSTPEPRFPSAQHRRHNANELAQIWLFTAGLYLRADFLDDGGSAINEAYKLVEAFETELGAQHSNARKLFEKGWGGGKGVDELWADVWSAKGDHASARELPFEALAHYEQALSHFPDHPEGIIGLSNLLMDIYEEKIPPELPQPSLASLPSDSGTSIDTPAAVPARPALLPNRPPVEKAPNTTTDKVDTPDATPAELNRLAARDRAYMLLSTLTRLGSAWDDPEAWLSLARAHEISKQVAKAKQALWWVVKLEEDRPVRPWRVVSQGGYAL